MDSFIKIHIKSDADTRAFVESEKKIAALEGKTKELTTALEKMGKASSSIGQGFGIGIGGQVLTSIQQIPAALEAAVMEGVRFNATLESSRLGIAAVIKQFDTTGRFANFKDALAASGDAIDLLKEKAKTSPATFQELVQGFQGLSGAYASAGLQMKQQVDLTVLMSQALAGLGIRSDQLLQESRALVTGNITEDASAAKILGITKAQVDAARESGKLFEFLTGKLSAFSEAGAEGAKSYTTQISNLEDSLTQLKGLATEEFFGQLKEGLSEVNKTLSSEKAEQWAAAIGSGLSQLPGMLKGAADAAGSLAAKLPGGEGFWNLKNTALFKNWAPVFAPAIDAKRQEQLDAEKLKLNTGLHGAQGEVAQTAAVAELEKAIAERRSQASEASGEELRQLSAHVQVLESILARRQQLLGTIKEEAAGAAQNWYGDEKALAKRSQAAFANRDANRKLGADVDAAALADMGPRERASRLQRQAEEARASFADDLSSGKGIDLASGSGFSFQEAQQTITALLDTEAAHSFEARLRSIMELEKELSAVRKEAGAAASANAETLASLNEELAIQRELTAGREGAARQLEIERDLRKELVKIAESELGPAEKERANQLAMQTAELQKQKAAADQLAKDKAAQNKRDAADADLAVESARPGSRAAREAKLKQALQQQRAKLEEAGFQGDDLESRLDTFGATKRRALMRADGRIGGRADRSNRDTLGDGISLLGAGRESIGTPMSAEFASAFRRGGVGEIMPGLPGHEEPGISKGAGPEIAGSLKGVASSLDRASESAKDAAQGAGHAAQGLAASNQMLAQHVSQLASLATSMRGLGPSFTHAMQNVERAVDELRAQLKTLDTRLLGGPL